jgi:microcystin-dependent protein
MLPPLFIPPVFPGNFPGQEPRHQFFPHPRPGTHDGVPVGAIIIFPGELLQQTQTLTSAMTDLRYMPWMICDGSSLLKTEYPELYRVIGELYGKEGSDKFKLPDYRGYFLRGVDLTKSLDKDDRTPPPGPAVNPQGVGSTQKDALQDHEHTLNMTPQFVTPEETPPVNFEVSTTAPLSQTGTIYQQDGVNVSKFETRAVNIAVNWLIKTK